MTNRYPSYKVILSDNQKVKLAKAYQDKSSIALRLSKGELIGNNKNDVNKNTTQEDTKAMASGVGVVLQDKREISVRGPPGGGGGVLVLMDQKVTRVILEHRGPSVIKEISVHEGPRVILVHRGPKGDKGDTWAQGPKGDTHTQGPESDTGAQEPKGDKGDISVRVLKGDKGDTSTQWPKGDT